MKNIILLLAIVSLGFQSCKGQKEEKKEEKVTVVEEKTSDATIIKDKGLLTTSIKKVPLLSYQYETMYPPEGVDSAYQRSGFIHPLKTLNGHVLTRVQPEDHYHHYGIWNPWTHVLFEGDTLDFWNLAKKQATVRFADFKLEKTENNIAEYQALHEHVVLKNGEEKIALNELQTVKVFQPDDNYYIVDFTFDYTCTTDSPFKILEYRYAGFGWRATEEWHKNNSEIISSEGKTRLDADSTPARWCIVQGELGEDYGGVVMMSNPQNFNHPEPLRIWPMNDKDRGDVFANFSPTKNMDWLLEPGKTYTLKYRLVVFNGKSTPEKAEALWQEYIK